MSADTPGDSGPKYDTGRSRTGLGAFDVALTDHACHRYKQRTPHDCSVSVREAWQAGEDIEHPALARSPGDGRDPHRARIYRHGDESGQPAGWGVVFLVVEDRLPPAERPAHHDANYVVATVINIKGYDHGPTRSYFAGYGPHRPGRGSSR